MKRYLILGLVITVLVVLAGGVMAARPNFQAAKVVNPVSGEQKNTVMLPPTAIKVAPNIYYLGIVADQGKLVEGYAFVDYKKEPGKPTGCNNDGICQGWESPDCVDCTGGGDTPTDTSSCYGFLSKGARWRVTESYVVGVDVDAVAVSRDLTTWDSQVAFEVFGDQDTSLATDGADTSSPDGKNEVMFGSISEPGVIAVAIVWGVFNGPPFARELVEWDVVFDNIDYVWGDAIIDPSVIDFENIATHEFGHAAGLNDLYEDKCSEQTMYGYADYGETEKRTLETGDITGIQGLYK